MKHRTILSILGLLSILLFSSGCTTLGVALGVGAKTGIEAAKEGGVTRAISDISIQTEINSLWFQEDVDIFRKLDLTINQGRVLITGVVQDSEHRVDAVRLAWQPRGVKQVINEIQVKESEGIPGFARDLWVSTQLRTKLTFDKDVQSINYSIDTVQGIVYLMGVAQNQSELNKVIDLTRNISGVKEVVSYVKFAGQPTVKDDHSNVPVRQYNRYDENTNSYNTHNNSIGSPVETSPRVTEYSNYKSYNSSNSDINHPIGKSPLAKADPYVQNDNLPPPGRWSLGTDGGTSTANNSVAVYEIEPASGGNTAPYVIREPVKVYPLND
jgi:osmotically-inducible protein OsmY